MTYSHFALYNVTGAVAWVLAFLLAGYCFGQIPTIKRNFHVVIVAIIVISMLPIAFEFCARGGRRRRPDRSTAQEGPMESRGDGTATRIERDSLGEMTVPADALWGASTQRAVENFPVSGERFPRALPARARAGEGRAAASERGARRARRAASRARSKRRRARSQPGALDAHFVVDVFQTGSGTSTNMNANEVIARRAEQLLGARRRRACTRTTTSTRASPRTT